MSQKRGGKKVSKKVSRMGELLNTPFFVHFFAPRGPIFGPPGGDPPKNPHFCYYRYGFGPKKGGFWGVPGGPPAAPRRPGRPPGISPPGPARAPRAPPRDPPLRDPPGTPLRDPPRRAPRTPEIRPCQGRAHDMAIDRSSHSVLVLKIAMWCERCALVVDRTWRSIGSRTACSSSRSPCGGTRCARCRRQ